MEVLVEDLEKNIKLNKWQKRAGVKPEEALQQRLDILLRFHVYKHQSILKKRAEIALRQFRKDYMRGVGFDDCYYALLKELKLKMPIPKPGDKSWVPNNKKSI